MIATQLPPVALDRLSSLLLERGVIPAAETMEVLFSDSAVWAPSVFRNLIHNPACLLPELQPGFKLHSCIPGIVLDSISCGEKEEGNGLSHRCRELFSWSLRHRLLPEQFSAILALLMEDQSQRTPFNPRVRKDNVLLPLNDIR
jgi:hypothetical protein